jgi:hypothetical protein
MLCVIWRWYARAPSEFTSIWNHIFGQDLSMSKVRAQFESFIRLFGPEAFPVYRAVFSVPFNDPLETYSKHRELVETTAMELDIELHRLSAELTSPSGRAKTAKCTKTRKLYRSLVKKASREERARSAQAPIVEYSPIPVLVFGGVALTTDVEFQTSEYLVDSEDSFELTTPATGRTFCTGTPQLAFRVFDLCSGTSYTDGHFIAGVFAGVATKPGGRLPPPFDPETDEGRRAIRVTCSSHFNNRGGPSAWVSVFTSLLESFTKGAQMVKPSIALIDLSHPLLKEQHRVLKASEVIRDAKKEGLVTFANTKHHAEASHNARILYTRHY